MSQVQGKAFLTFHLNALDELSDVARLSVNTTEEIPEVPVHQLFGETSVNFHRSESTASISLVGWFM